MTQLLALLTQDRAYLVADSQLSYARNGRRIGIADQKAAKLVNLGGTHFMAYAGPSVLGANRKRTEQWIAEVMYRVGRGGLPATVEEIAASSLRLIPKGVPERLHFMLVGFARFSKGKPLRAHCTIISNQIDEWGRLCKPANGGKMRIVTVALQHDAPFAVTVGGQHLRTIRKRRLRDDLMSLITSKAEPKIVLRRLAAEIRFTATGRPNGFVGPRVLAACVPRYAQEALDRGERIGFYCSEPARDDAFPCYSIYDSWGAQVEEVTKLFFVKNDIEGRWIGEVMWTERTENGSQMQIRVVKAPDSGDEKSPQIFMLFGHAKVQLVTVNIKMMFRLMPTTADGIYWMHIKDPAFSPFVTGIPFGSKQG